MAHAKNYETESTFVKLVLRKLGPLFWTWCIYLLQFQKLLFNFSS